MMKKNLLAAAILALLLSGSIEGLGQGRGKSARKAPTRTSQICTGCCDPCYEDDVAKIKQATGGTSTNSRSQRRAAPASGKNRKQ